MEEEKINPNPTNRENDDGYIVAFKTIPLDGEEAEAARSRDGGRDDSGTVILPTVARKTTKRKKGALRTELEYTVEDVPPWYLCMFLGFQHYLIMFGATVANPLILAQVLCVGDDNLAKSEMIGTIFFVSGISTLLQTTLGTRLPIVQGGTFTFVAPSVAIMSLEKWKCPTVQGAKSAMTTAASVLANMTAATMTTEATDYVTYMVQNVTNMVQNVTESGVDAGGDAAREVWQVRMRELQGAIMVASLFQVLIGATGIMSFLLRFIGPLSIAPCIALAGLALFNVAANLAMKQWWICIMTIVLIVAFSQYTKNFEIPCIGCSREKGFHKVKFAIFRLFPVILAIVISWIICIILTATNVFPDNPDDWGYEAKTSIRIEVLNEAAWFRVPYPGQWGLPTVSVSGVFGILAGVLASMVESVGDYYACARMAGAPPPPAHAINRGIMMEGIGCVLAGAFGTGSGTTSYSENIGAIGITKVASRRVIQAGAIIMIVMGVIGKFGAIFVTIPDPIIGGVFIVMFGMIIAVGLSNLQYVDMNSSRNLFIIGFSFFFGLTLPKFMETHPNSIKTGSLAVDQILTVLLSTSMFVGGMSAFLLDNTIAGTLEERGMAVWRQQLVEGSSRDDHAGKDRPESSGEDMVRMYDFPFGMGWVTGTSWTRYIPICPTFTLSSWVCGGDDSKKKKKRTTKKRKGDSGGQV